MNFMQKWSLLSHNMKPRSILIIAFLFCTSWLYAQTDFKPGYVITNSNDTLYGEIDYRGDRLMGQVCKFRSNGHDIVGYTPDDIVAYRFTDHKYFVSREVSGKKIFLEFLVKGQVNIYYMRDALGDHYFIDKEGQPLTEMTHEEGVQEKNGRTYFYSTKNHLGVLNYYMQDAPSVKTQIGNMKKPQHDNLIMLAKNYHHAVCADGDPCIVFEKKQPLTKVAIDVAGGMVYYRDSESSFTGGVLLNFWMPRVNEKVYFRTGLLYSKYKYEDEDENPEHLKIAVYKIPLMLEYIYPKSIIRPKAAYGLSIYNKMGSHSVTCMGGFNIWLSNSISLSLEYDIDFEAKYAFLPGTFFSQSFLCGFQFRF